MLLFGLVCWTFWAAVGNDFINYDDPDYVTRNGRVQQGLSWGNLRWAFNSSEAANWHPVTWLSHMLDCQLFGLKQWGHHLTSVLLHAGGVVLLFLVLSRMTGAIWRSFIVAAFFGLHPLRLESVAWVAERKDVLSTFFFLLTLWAYVRYVEERRKSIQHAEFSVQCRGAAMWYWVAFGLFVLGLMSKPMLVTLPCALLLLDYWPLRRFQDLAGHFQASEARRIVTEKLPFFLAAMVLCGVTFAAQKHGGAISLSLPLAERVENALISYCRYLGKMFWPADLAVFYPMPHHWPLGNALAAGALLLAITLLAVVLRRRYPFLLVGWLWFIGILVPVIGLVPVGEQSMADRYSYVPSIGIVLFLVWGAHELLGVGRNQLIGLTATAAAAALACAAVTRQQLGYWKNSETLFARALVVTGNNYLAHAQLGAVLDEQGSLEEATAQYVLALRENIASAETHNNLGLVLARQGRPAEAVKEYLEALKWRPNYANPHNHLGYMLDQQGRPEEAIREYDAALRLNPDYADAHCNRAIALAHQGRQDEALEEFQTALRLQPNAADAHSNLGVILERKGQLDAAIEHYQAAIKLQPGFARAHFNLGVALARKGQLADAIEEFQAALRLKPDFEEARKNLASVREAFAAKESKGLKNN
jgi:tetratricopeptide (TPR) repeat protein